MSEIRTVVARGGPEQEVSRNGRAVRSAPPYEQLGFREEMVALSALGVDDGPGGYQRRQSETKVKALLPYDVSTGGTLLVNRRPDGRLYAVDGRHRAEAARRSGLTHLPCRVVHVSREREARYFIEMNWATLVVNARAKFRADVVAGEPEACAIKQTVEECGFTLAYEPRGGAVDTLSAVDAARAICHPFRHPDAFDVQPLHAALEMIGLTWPGQPGNGAGTLLRAVALLRRRECDHLDAERFAERLFVYTPVTLMKAGATVAKAYGVSSVVGTAHKMVEEYNSRMPKGSRMALRPLV